MTTWYGLFRTGTQATALGLAGLMALPTPAAATQIQRETIVELWTTFFEICGPVASDPVGTIANPTVLDGYRHTLVVQNEAGNRVFVSHVANDDGLGIASEYSVLNTGQMAALDCTVSYNVQANLDVAQVREVARSLIEAEGTMKLVGGPNRIQTASGFFSQGGLENVSDSFFIEGAIPGTDLAVVANFETVTFLFAIVGSMELPS